MKQFKIKDLLVAVVPEEREREAVCQAGVSRCPNPSCGQFGNTCFMQTCPLNTCANVSCPRATCFAPSCPGLTFGTCIGISECIDFTCPFSTRFPCGGRTFITIDQPGPLVQAGAEISQLRDELQTVLGRVMALEQQAETDQQPRSVEGVEDIEELEKHLRDALDELAARKKTLKGE